MPGRLRKIPVSEPGIEVILFDLGGVLVEVNGVPAMMEWSGETFTPEILWQRWLNSPSVREFETGRIQPDSFARQVIDEMSLRVGPDEFLAVFTGWPRGLFPGAGDLIRRISPVYTRAVLSNSNSLHWPRMIGEIGLAALFDHCFASHLMGKIKPDSEVFEHVLEELDCDPGRMLYLDDNRLNVEAARTLGIQAVEARGLEEVERVLLEYKII